MALTLHHLPPGLDPATQKASTLPSTGSVRRYLRHRQSQQYFREGGWTTNLHEAQPFRDAIQAARTCAAHGLTDVDLVLRFSDSADDLFCTPIR